MGPFRDQRNCVALSLDRTLIRFLQYNGHCDSYVPYICRSFRTCHGFQLDDGEAIGSSESCCVAAPCAIPHRRAHSLATFMDSGGPNAGRCARSSVDEGCRFKCPPLNVSRLCLLFLPLFASIPSFGGFSVSIYSLSPFFSFPPHFPDFRSGDLPCCSLRHPP